MKQEPQYTPSSFTTDWAAVEIKRVKASQWRELFHLLADSFMANNDGDYYCCGSFYDRSIKAQKEVAQKLATSNGESSFIAWEKSSGRPVGVIHYYLTEYNVQSISIGLPGHIISGEAFWLWVHPAYRCRGIGTRLVKAAEDWVCSANPAIQKLVVGVDLKDSGNIEFFKGLDYEPEELGLEASCLRLSKMPMCSKGKPKPRSIDLPSYLEIKGLQAPLEFYWVAFDATPDNINEQAPLAGMQLPGPNVPWERLHSYNFRWIVCLCSTQPIYDPAPLKRLLTVELTDLAENDLPDDPEMEEQAINIIAAKVIEKLVLGEGVIVHCAGGRGRTGTVLGVTLKKTGYSSKEITEFLDAVHQARGKTQWWESPWQREVVERASECKLLKAMNQVPQTPYEIWRVQPSQWREMWNVHLDALQQSPQAFKGSYDFCRSISEQAAKNHAAMNATSEVTACFLAWNLSEKDPIGEVQIRLDDMSQYERGQHSSTTPEYRATLSFLWVRPKDRNNHLGLDLMQCAERWALSQNPELTHFRLHVQPGNREVTKFYEKQGYEVPDAPADEEIILWKKCR
jgi:ribosomal protein S18 acetylase RimI-like enzyme